jgi:hypothetical protein
LIHNSRLTPVRCEEESCDAKCWIGLSQVRVKQIEAWWRLFGFFVIAASALESPETAHGIRLINLLIREAPRL